MKKKTKRSHPSWVSSPTHFHQMQLTRNKLWIFHLSSLFDPSMSIKEGTRMRCSRHSTGKAHVQAVVWETLQVLVMVGFEERRLAVWCWEAHWTFMPLCSHSWNTGNTRVMVCWETQVRGMSAALCDLYIKVKLAIAALSADLWLAAWRQEVGLCAMEACWPAFTTRKLSAFPSLPLACSDCSVFSLCISIYETNHTITCRHVLNMTLVSAK